MLTKLAVALIASTFTLAACAKEEPKKADAKPAATAPAKAEAKKEEPKGNKAKKECTMVKDPKTGVEKEKCKYPKKAEKK